MAWQRLGGAALPPMLSELRVYFSFAGSECIGLTECLCLWLRVRRNVVVREKRDSNARPSGCCRAAVDVEQR